MAESASLSPSASPSLSPSSSPSLSPSISESLSPSISPSSSPSISPSSSPSASPSKSPSSSPSSSPSASPSISPSPSPSEMSYEAHQPEVTQYWKGVHLVVWKNLNLEGEVGAPFICPKSSRKSVQITGRISFSTLTIEGSNTLDEVPTWATLSDEAGNSLAMTSLGLKQIREDCVQIRPRISTVDVGITDVNVYLLVIL